MRDLVIHEPSGLTLDFGEADFGGDDQDAVVHDWRERGHHAVPGEFICYRHRDRERPWLYLRQRGELLFASHWPGSALDGSHMITHGITDEHQRIVEYVSRAGETAGFEARTEVRLPTNVIPDAVIYGSQVQMGVEVQRSKLTASAAKARTTKARHAGVQPIWFSDNRSDPPWLWAVPGVRMNPDMSWGELPPPRSASVVSGVRLIIPRRCRNISNSRCPRRRYGCNEWHPDHAPRQGTLVDDLALMVPAGELVPMLYSALSGREYVLIVSQIDKLRYEAMVGRSADVPLRQRERRPQQAPRIDCVADAGALVEPRSTVVCPAHTYWPESTWRCAVLGCPGSGDA